MLSPCDQLGPDQDDPTLLLGEENGTTRSIKCQDREVFDNMMKMWHDDGNQNETFVTVYKAMGEEKVTADQGGY